MLTVQLTKNKHTITLPTERHIKDKRILHVQMPCGEYVCDQSNLSIVNVMQDHVDGCVKCEYKIVGHVKRQVMKQQHVADLFTLGIDYKRTKYDSRFFECDSSVRSENGILWHYNNIEGIRLPDGTCISNNECNCSSHVSLWGGGALHPRLDTRYRLPLSTLAKDVNKDLINAIDPVINTDEDAGFVVFRIRNNSGETMTMLSSPWYQSFMNQVPTTSFYEESFRRLPTVTEAYNMLIPPEVHAFVGGNLTLQRSYYENYPHGVLRNGEFWFVPLAGLSDRDVTDISHGTRFNFNKKQYLFGSPHRATRTGTIPYELLLNYIPLKGQTKLPSAPVTVAKGHINHITQRWGKTMALGNYKTWYAVFPNLAVKRWKI